MSVAGNQVNRAFLPDSLPEISGDLPSNPIAIVREIPSSISLITPALGICVQILCAANGPLLETWLTSSVADYSGNHLLANGEDPLLEIYTGSCDSIETTPPIACAEDGRVDASNDAQVSVASAEILYSEAKRANDSATTNSISSACPISTILPQPVWSRSPMAK